MIQVDCHCLLGNLFSCAGTIFVLSLEPQLWHSRGGGGNLREGAAGGGGERGRRTYSFVACLSHLAIDRASLSKRSTVLTLIKDTSDSRALNTLFPYITYVYICIANLIPYLLRRLWPPSIYQVSSKIIVIVFSLLSSVPNSSVSHSSIIFIFS